MSRPVVVTPLFFRRLNEFLDEYAAKGATRFVERLEQSYLAMVERLASFEYIGRARRRTVGGKSMAMREYVLDAGARDFLVPHVAPDNPDEPVVLLNIRIGGQNRFRW